MTYEHKVRNLKDFEEDRFRPGYTGPKLDGVRAFYYPGEPHLVSRQNKPMLGLSHLVDQFKLSPVQVPIDMELTVPGLEFNEASGIIRRHAETPEVVAYIIDIPVEGGLVTRHGFKHYFESGSVKIISNYWVKTLSEFYNRHESFLKQGHEGSVWKSKGAQYLNKRNYDWMRLVPVKSEDCVILDVYEGKGKMTGMLGGLIVCFSGQRCKVGTLKGFDYAKRTKIWENPDEYIGKVIEVQYKQLQPSGKPRQPRGKGIRWDKSAKECARCS